MKKLILALVALTSVSAFAYYPRPNDSWERIRAIREVQVGNPFGATFGTDGAFNVCYTDTELQSIKDVPYCAEWKVTTVRDGDGNTTHDEYSCVRYENIKVRLPRTYDQQVCLKEVQIGNGEAGIEWKCLEYGTQTVHAPLTYRLDVGYNHNGEIGYQLLFTKKYDLPACK